MFNQFNLGSDLMEPFRPIIDRVVVNVMPEKFEHDEKMIMLQTLQQIVIIDNRSEYLNRAIQVYCRSVFDALNDQDPSLIKFWRYEL